MTDPGLTPAEERALRARLDALPASVDPARDLWPDIRARMAGTPRRAAPVVIVHARTRWGTLAAAAAVLVLASVSVTWLAMRPATPGAPVAELGDPTPAVAAPLASFASYERSAADLAGTLEKRAGRLDPATRAVLERSLRTIDEALAEARAALAADPASAAYQTFVEAAYRQKIDFLRRANDIAALQGP